MVASPEKLLGHIRRLVSRSVPDPSGDATLLDRLHGMVLSKWKIAAVLLVVAGVTGGAAGMLWPSAPKQVDRQQPDAMAAAARDAGKPGAEGGQVRTDRYGDPLPPGALARVGSVRLRDESAQALAFSPDGKVLASIGGGNPLASIRHDAVYLWEVATGKELQHLPWVFSFSNGAFLPDGRTLWLQRDDGRIYFWDTTASPDRGVLPAPLNRRRGYGRFLAASPDGKVLATADGKAVRLWDVVTGRELRRLEAHEEEDGPGGRPFPLPGRGRPAGPGLPNGLEEQEKVRQAVFSSDGKRLAFASHREIHIWDLVTGKELGRRHGWFESVQIALSPDGRTLAVAGGSHLGGGGASFWDVATGQEIRSLRGVRGSPSYDIAFSPDGKTLLLRSSNGLELRDVASGKTRRELPGIGSSFAFSPDGKTLAACVGSRVRLWDVATGRERIPVAGCSETIDFIALLADSRTLASASWGRPLQFWELPSGKELLPSRARPRPVVTWGAVLSPDGKVLASPDPKGRIVHLWDVATGKELRQLKTGDRPEDSALALAFSPDGKLLVSYPVGHRPRPAPRPENALQLWDVGEGRCLGSFQGYQDLIGAVAFTPDGKLLASSALWPDSTVRIWDVGTRRELRKFGGAYSRSLVFSPDGRFLAGDQYEDPCDLWEVASGRELFTLCSRQFQMQSRRQKSGQHPVFFPDGGTLITGDDAGKVSCWDVATGRLRRQWRAHESPVAALALSADGRFLVSKGQTTALVWDMNALLPKEPFPGRSLSATDLHALWADLRGADATRAYQAMRTLAAAPEQAPPFLRRRLRPALDSDDGNAKRLARLLADLDSDSFAVREKATRELEELGPWARPELRKKLAERPSPEVRRRVEHVLRKLPQVVEEPAPPPEELRRLRAVAVLEQAGTEESRQVLRDLSRGAPEAPLTREAKAALGRLARRPGGKP